MKSGKLSLELTQSSSCPTTQFLPFPAPLQNAFILSVSCCLSAAHLFHTSLWFPSTFLYPSFQARSIWVRVPLWRQVKEHIHDRNSPSCSQREWNKRANKTGIVRKFQTHSKIPHHVATEQKGLIRIMSQPLHLWFLV